MTSPRDRIAAAVCDWHFGEGTAWDESTNPSREDWRGCADAVINELGLRRETIHAWRNGRSVPAGTRHVTDWEPADG